MNYVRDEWPTRGPDLRPPPELPGADSSQLDLKGILGLLRRKIWLIVAALVICVTLGGVAIFALKPVYTATALILVDPSKKNLLNPDAPTGSSSSDSARVDSEVELVKSEATLRKVVANMDLIDDAEFGPKLGLRSQLLAFFGSQPELPSGEEALSDIQARLRQAVSVQRRGLTFLIAVQATSQRPEMAANLANAVAQTYINEQLEIKRSAIDSFSAILGQGLEEARARVNRTDGDFDIFIEDNIANIAAVSGNNTIQTLYEQLRSTKSFTESASASLTAARTNLQNQDYAALTQSLQSEALGRLEAQRQQLLARLAGTVSESNETIALRAELAGVNDGLADAANSALDDLRQQLTQSETQTGEVRTQLQDAIVAANLPNELQTRIFEVLEGAQIARTQYQALLSRQQDVALEAGLQVADSRLASVATPPNNPSFPNPTLILALASILGLGIGIGLAFLIENFVGGFTTPEQMQSVLGIPVAASGPKQRAPKTVATNGEPTLADALVHAPLSVFSEAVRRLRMGIDQRLRFADEGRAGGDGAVIMVTSAAPNEGKTTISLSLARAYALSGMSTLLIDCDLRKPSIHRMIGREPSSGLLDYLLAVEGGPSLESIMTVDPGTGAQVVLGSRRSDIPTDQLMAGKTFARFIAAARKNFDRVILDTPPVGPVVDGLYLAGIADAMVFVVRWSSTPQQEAKAALSSIFEAAQEGTPIVAVLNQQEATRNSYRGRYAGYYSEA